MMSGILRSFTGSNLHRFFLAVSACVLAACGVAVNCYASLFSDEEVAWLHAHPELTIIINNGPFPVSIWTDPRAEAQTHESPPQPAPDRRPPPPLAGNQPPRDMEGAPQTRLRPQVRGVHPPPGRHPPPPPPGSRSPRPQEGAFSSSGPPPLIEVGEDQQGYFQGIAADYLREIEAVTGITFITSLVANNNIGAINDAFANQSIDLMPSILQGENNPPNLILTDTYIRLPVVVVMKTGAPYLDDIQLLESMKVAGVLSIQPKLAALGLTVQVDHLSPHDGLMGVASGKFDAFICGLPSLSHELDRTPVTGVKIVGELPVPSEFCMGVSPEIREFVPIFNKALKAIPQENRDAIWRKWFKVNYEKKWISTRWLWLSVITGCCLLIGGLFGILYYRRRLNLIHDSIAALDPHLLRVQIDNNITITEVTEALCQVTGFKADYLLGKPLMILGSPDKDQPSSVNHLFSVIEQGKSWKGEVRLLKKDGTALWTDVVMSPLRRKNEKGGCYTVIYQDASKRKHFEKLANCDELTGLYNRRHFNRLAPDLLQQAAKDGKYFGLLILDVDNFKKYNDNYGHPAGDQVLASIGKTLRKTLQRSEDLSFRLGGEEFGVVSLLASAEDGDFIGRKILDSIGALKIEHLHNPPGIITVSIGICVVASGSKGGVDEIYYQADKALYQAKEKGRNRYVISTGSPV